MRIKECNGVYPLSNDSFFLLEVAMKELQNLKMIIERPKVLEIGTGTGIIAINLAKNDAIVTATDISYKAVKCAELNAKINGVNIDIRQGDLFEPISEGESFDLIIFNPPYLVKDELDKYVNSSMLLAIRGNHEPIELLHRFIENSIQHLSQDGRVVFLIESKLFNMLKERLISLYAKIIELKNIEFETLLAIKISKN